MLDFIYSDRIGVDTRARDVTSIRDRPWAVGAPEWQMSYRKDEPEKADFNFAALQRRYERQHHVATAATTRRDPDIVKLCRLEKQSRHRRLKGMRKHIARGLQADSFSSDSSSSSSSSSDSSD